MKNLLFIAGGTYFIKVMTYEKISSIILFDTSKGFNPLSANPTKWSNTLKQFVGNLPTNCLSVLDNFVGLALKGFRAP